MKLNITIISKEKIVYQDKADSIFIPTQMGLIEVLPEHMQLVSALAHGEVILKNDNKENKFSITGGVLEVRTHSEVIILADLVKGE